MLQEVAKAKRKKNNNNRSSELKLHLGRALLDMKRYFLLALEIPFNDKEIQIQPAWERKILITGGGKRMLEKQALGVL